MTGFAAAWLELREPLDRAARSPRLARRLAATRRDHGILRLFDLGAGTGSNLRYLAPLLGGRQHWTLVDDDAEVLAAAWTALAGWASGPEISIAEQGRSGIVIEGKGFSCRVESLSLDLASGLIELPLTQRCIVTASALLDLVSGPWLDGLADRCQDASATCLAALSYDGRVVLDPADPFDARAIELVNRHQLGDKGFGPALGPAAPALAAKAFRERGFAVETAVSDWTIEARDRGPQAELLEGWRRAARDIDPASSDALDAWHARRLEQIERGQARVIVGHGDILCLPATMAGVDRR